MMEFSVWGIAPRDEFETLLCEVVRGKRITDKRLAEAVKVEAIKRGNKNVRIMELDMACADIAGMFSASAPVQS
jgi:hypothetical protein